MVDARFPERWLLDRRVRRLSDSEFRTFTLTLVWSAASRTEGVIDTDDIDALPGATVKNATALVTAGLWTPLRPGTWYVTDFNATQTSRAEHELLENARRREREKKQRQRARSSTTPVPGDVPEDQVPGDRPAGPHRKEGRQDGRQALDDEAFFKPLSTTAARGYDR